VKCTYCGHDCSYRIYTCPECGKPLKMNISRSAAKPAAETKLKAPEEIPANLSTPSEVTVEYQPGRFMVEKLTSFYSKSLCNFYMDGKCHFRPIGGAGREFEDCTHPQFSRGLATESCEIYKDMKRKIAPKKSVIF
jgi:hypothetical protein